MQFKMFQSKCAELIALWNGVYMSIDCNILSNIIKNKEYVTTYLCKSSSNLKK